jgi:ribosomal protein S18 acetylase RimI-like enzyme
MTDPPTEQPPPEQPPADHEAAATLTAAFLQDPLMCWIFDDARARPSQLHHWWAWMLDRRPAHARLMTTEDSRSAALWYGPDPAADDPQRDFPAMLAGLLGAESALAKLRGLAVIPSAHPHDQRHWYLAAVGTRPDAQNRGSGRLVIAPVLADADAAGVGCYLESSNVRNIAFYERLGFRTIGLIQIPGGPALTPMWRAPAVDDGGRGPFG